MPFEMVSGIDRGMGVLDGVVYLGRPIVTDGDFVAWLCESDTLFPDFSADELFCLVMWSAAPQLP